MKLTNNQYSEMVEKLANEIVEDFGVEKTAGEGQKLTPEQNKKIIEAKKAQAKAQAQGGSKASEEEKAAAVYENAMNKIALCQEMYEDGTIQKQACIETLAEAGLYDENGLDKEAAESSEEAIQFTNQIAGIYDDGSEKIAAAEECYADACIEVNAAMEVLASYGYEFE